MTTGRTNLETNSVFQSFILMHMPQTAAPLEEKIKVLPEQRMEEVVGEGRAMGL